MFDLLFYLFGFSCFANIKYKHIFSFGRIQPNQTGGQPYSDTSPWSEYYLLVQKSKNIFCSRFTSELAYSCERKQSTLLTRRSHQGLRSSDFITHYKTNSINVLQVGRKKLTSTNQFGSSRASHRRWKCLMCSRRYQSVPVRVLKGTLFTLCNLAMTRYNSKFRQIFWSSSMLRYWRLNKRFEEAAGLSFCVLFVSAFKRPSVGDKGTKN